MPTAKQLLANRANAQRCTGPSSVEGKTRSSWNALKSGIHAESEILPWEDPAELAALRAEYHDYHQPVSPEERSVVDSLAQGEFLARRLRRSEVKIVMSKLPSGADLSNEAVIGKSLCDASADLARLHRRMDANNRAFHKNLDELRQIQAERPPIDPPPTLELVSPPETDVADPPEVPPEAEPQPDPQPADPEPPPPPAAPQRFYIVLAGRESIGGPPVPESQPDMNADLSTSQTTQTNDQP